MKNLAEYSPSLSIILLYFIRCIHFATTFLFGNCANIIATNIKIHPKLSLIDNVSFKIKNPPNTEKVDSKLKIKTAIVGL